jgi:tripartite-type tricarboxylate transporter receptor subunit TctC
MWLPPGTPDEIADALSTAFQTAFEQDAELLQKYGAIAGETPRWTNRATGTKTTKENEDIFEDSIAITKREGDRLIAKYFPQYVSN